MVVVMTTKDEVVLPPKVQEKIKGYLGQLQQMQAQVNQYFQGVVDSMGLEGQWDLDAKRMTAVNRAQPVEDTPPNGVSAEIPDRAELGV